MSNCNTIVSVLTKNRSDQNQRFIHALQPENIQLNEFEISDWILFAYNFAGYINYFDTLSNTTTSDWKPFFDYFDLKGKNPTIEEAVNLTIIKKEINAFVNDYKEKGKKEGNLTPHLTLFIAFLLLLENSKKKFNQLTKKHLDFYYKDILKIEKLPATPDKVHMIFELAKNASQQKIEAKTGFDGGKDSKGQKRTYVSSEELIANKISIGALKNVYHHCDDNNNNNNNNTIVASPIANSYDGLGKAFPDEKTQWWPFGHPKDDKNPIELPDATLGFAIASPILALNEGKRNVEFTFNFATEITGITENSVINNTSIYLTTQKKWHKVSELSTTITGSTFVTSSIGKELKIAFQLNENVDAITNYNSKVYGDEFNSDLPIAKFLISTAELEGYELYKSLAQNTIESITINVDVQNIKSVALENDNSVINPLKPFYPFTTIPVEGSNFYIKYEEAFAKKWNTIAVDIAWKNIPENLATHYIGYKKDSKDAINLSTFTSNQKDSSKSGIVTNNAYFRFDLEILSNSVWTPTTLIDESLFSNDDTTVSSFSLLSSTYNTEKKGQLKMILNTSFLHSLYPKIYAMALAADDIDVILPNEPYTPLVESLTFNYSATETTNFIRIGTKTIEEVFTENPAKLFQIHPFGYSEEHNYLKSLLDYVTVKDSYLVPTYCKGGELYIGLENTEELQQISLLFQVLEGSENPLAESFTGKQKIEWAILGNNEWKTLEYADIVVNETDNLLQSGIFKFNLPKETTIDNTKLPKNYVWLQAKMHKTYDAVCKVIGIHSQVVLSTFENNENELSHLKTGLEANSISKLVQRISNVKSVTQPYNSFDYKPEETDSDYYRRISERLRHKNRAVTMWDYEHILLQEFPELYKIKCLNHTSETSYQAPGNVTLVVVPDTKNKNAFDMYQPRVSTATLNKVKNHISQLNSMHVNTFVINPNYEEVTVQLDVKFQTGLDENYYSQELNTDIIKFLSPWAFDTSIPITFGVSIHISSLIHYIEELKYVDFLQNVKLLKKGAPVDKVVMPSDPKSILVSAKNHEIGNNIIECTTSTEQKEECQL